MRLLHVDTLELHEFFDDKIPPYAILSHRWEQDEVSYKDVRKRQNLSSQGWQKVQNFCRLVQRKEPGVKYAWIDTCCIDKRSSAELSEAINSMFKWYRNARVCFAYLSDVDQYSPDSAGQGSFRKSVWFTRGWTLQELLAPKVVFFVTSDWLTIIGKNYELAGLIADVTGIKKTPLSGYYSSFRYSTAQKMSWAATRVCAREEDHAYCLMGLFDVNMPLLYGEGREKAFVRLQTEILKISDDESIFAWGRRLRSDSYSLLDPSWQQILAPSPILFQYSDNIIRHEFMTRSEYVMTNKGIRFEAILGKISSRECFVLNCCEQALLGKEKPYVLFVTKVNPEFYRIYLPDEEEYKYELDLEELPVKLFSGTPQRFYVK